MKFSCAYTDNNGLTVSLGVSAPPSFFEPSAGTSEATCADPDLVSSSFEQAIPELSLQLVQAHAGVELALQKSFVSKLHKEVSGS